MSGSQATGLGEIADVKADEVWPNEVLFSSWLAENLGKLRDILKPDDLELVGTEQAVGEFRCDIVAREAGLNGRAVVIENQFDKTDHRHLGQLLAYATHHNAEIIVWIAPEMRDEHRAAMDWLNKITPEDISLSQTGTIEWAIDQLYRFKAAFSSLIPVAADAAKSATLQAEPPPQTTDPE